MAKILIFYASTYGQTEKISKFLLHELKAMGNEVDAFQCKYVPETLALDDYDAVIIGGSVHAGGFQRPLIQWVGDQSQKLGSKPSAFFAVCLAILQKEEKVQAQVRTSVEDFFRKTHWRPERFSIFAGSLAYTKYGLLTRLIMKWITKRAGGDTDISRDHEYTNWDEVRTFATTLNDAFNQTPRQFKTPA